MLGFGGSAVNDGIHSAAGFGRNFLHAVAFEDFLDGVSATFTEGHVVFFGTAFVAVTDDLDVLNIATAFEAVRVGFEDIFCIRADGRFVEVEVGEFRLAERCIDASFVSANFAAWAVCVREAFGFGNAAVIFADFIGLAIFRGGFRIALRTAATVTAFLICGAVQAGVGIAVAIDALARTAVADVAFVFFARAVFVVTAFGAFRIKAVFIVGFAIIACGAICIFIAFGVGRRAAISHTNKESCSNNSQNIPTSFHRIPP